MGRLHRAPRTSCARAARFLTPTSRQTAKGEFSLLLSPPLAPFIFRGPGISGEPALPPSSGRLPAPPFSAPRDAVCGPWRGRSAPIDRPSPVWKAAAREAPSIGGAVGVSVVGRQPRRRLSSAGAIPGYLRDWPEARLRWPQITIWGRPAGCISHLLPFPPRGPARSGVILHPPFLHAPYEDLRPERVSPAFSVVCKGE